VLRLGTAAVRGILLARGLQSVGQAGACEVHSTCRAKN
jgi:hypothetical protein